MKLAPALVSAWMKTGVEVERLTLGLRSAAAPVVTVTSAIKVQAGGQAAVVVLRDPESQRLASEIFGRMKALDPTAAGAPPSPTGR